MENPRTIRSQESTARQPIIGLDAWSLCIRSPSCHAPCDLPKEGGIPLLNLRLFHLSDAFRNDLGERQNRLVQRREVREVLLDLAAVVH
jgi:hypothetical protein